MNESLKNAQRTWDRLAESDPLWAIATEPGKRGNKWDLDEFFASGEHLIAELMTRAAELGYPQSRGRALDFGCGVGRLTQALGHYFETCTGVDVSRQMIERAAAYNRQGSKCTYLTNTKDDLGLFADDAFDFVCSYIVLQHIAPELTKRYIAELVRVLKPGGLLFFQLLGHIHTIDLPGNAFAARIDLERPIQALPASGLADVHVRVENLSNHPWPANSVKLGNHWRQADGALIVQDDARADLVAELAPRESVELVLQVTAPSRPGDYLLELDLVQEGVTWFAEQGHMRPTRIPVRVMAAESPAPSAASAQSNGEAEAAGGEIAAMEVHGLDKSIVLGLLADAGGRLVHLHDDGIVTGWQSDHYYVTK